MRRIMKSLFILVIFSILATSCSNPFSSQKRSVLQDNITPKNMNCSDVRFDQSEINAKQVRGVIHCLNQNKDLKELENWINEASDSELEPLISKSNSILKNESEFLYGLKEIYLDEKNNGELQNLLNQLFAKLNTSDKRDDLVNLIKDHSNWISNYIENSNYKINFQHLSLLPEVKSFNRGIIEQYQTLNYKNIIESIYRYHQQTDAVSFQKIFSLISNVSVEITSNENSVEKISGFLNWIMSENRVKKISVAAKSLTQIPISCFGGDRTLNNPLKTVLDELSSINPKDSKDFFQKKIPELILLSKGYCSLPAEVTDAVKVLQSASEEETFSTFFELIQPLLKDETFSKLLTSSAFETLTQDLNQFNNTHLIQDTITLANWLKNNPITGAETSSLLDSIFSEFKPNELIFLIGVVPEETSFYKSLQKIIQELPAFKSSTKINSNNNWITIFTKKSFSPVIELISRMNDQNKITPIVDRVIEMFKNLLERGKNSYQRSESKLPAHSKNGNSQNWELSFWKNTQVSVSSPCADMPIDFNFFMIAGDQTPKHYLENLEKISACYGTNQSFLSIKDLATYLIKSDSGSEKLNRFSSIQSGIINYIFNINSEVALKSIDQVLRLSSSDQTQISRAIESSSTLVSKSLNELHTAKETRKLIAKYLENKETYLAILKQKEFSSNHLPEASANHLKEQLIELTLKNLPALMKQFCNSLDINLSDCDIEPDQVIAFKKSPNELAENIVNEYFASAGTWLNPLKFSHWKRNENAPADVGTLEFHLNPMFKQIQGNPKSMSSIFSFIKRNQKSDYSLLTFLTEKSKNFTLIPYIYQNPDFPNTNQEFNHLIRLRIMNDLDRLETLATNADFKPFGVMKNFAMAFITEIGTSWGDVDLSQRPKLGTSETFNTARNNIYHEYAKFNLSIIQKLGACDQRGRGSIGRFIHRFACGGELGDIRARLFNLGYMLSILDDDREMKLLRDLFYSIYENETNSQVGIYINGTKAYQYTDIDLLEIIPKITRLGLLHQAGVAIASGNSISTSSILKVIDQTVMENKDQQLANFLVSKNGELFFKDLLSLAMNFNSKEDSNIAKLLSGISNIKNQQWLLFSLKQLEKFPNLISTYSPSIHSMLMESEFSDLSPEMIDLLSKLSTDLDNSNLSVEVASLLKSVSGSQEDIKSVFSTKLSQDLTTDWIKLLAEVDHQSNRNQISTAIIGKSFDNFCDVFSDADLAQKTYKFLDNSNQNSGVLELLEECRRFLH